MNFPKISSRNQLPELPDNLKSRLSFNKLPDKLEDSEATKEETLDGFKKHRQG